MRLRSKSIFWYNVIMSQKIIKSKERIKDHGEVFTPDFIVNDMLKMVDNELLNIESRFLEPACGDGNFLAPVLKSKLEVVSKRYKKSQTEFEKYSFISISSLYGIDILQDNVELCRQRLLEILKDKYTSIYKKKYNSEFLNCIQFVLKYNIINGDALSLKYVNSDSHIVFPEWSFVSGNMVKRVDYEYRDILDYDPIPGLDPIKSYPLTHYLKVKNDITN